VTGAAGFVGSHVVEQLLTFNIDVVAVGSLTHNGESFRLLEAITTDPEKGHFNWLRHDLAAPFTATQVRQIGRLDAIVNVASLSSVDASITDPVGFVQNNVNTTLNVLELARNSLNDSYVNHFIHVSTDEVYGENTPCADGHHAPSSPYAASKAAQEDICAAWRKTFNVPVSIVRSANMFGERQSELAFIPRIVRAIVEDKPLPIHVDQHGKPGIRNYSYVGNVARYLAYRATTIDDTIYDTTLRGQLTLDNYSLALNVAAILDRELKFEFIDAVNVRPSYDRKYELHGVEWDAEIQPGEALRRTVINTARRMGLDA
jgi:dTDP-glucose 4,6-dehydratase